ncbi:MAG TPA: shikimate dehydrogenase [Betaproteobacteria bacterium]|nr:shikimate dehydrogenase [Betaproteobacteria bacterium]
MSDCYAVIGNPIAHSQSPFIHAEFARQTGQDLHYRALLAPRDGFTSAARQFQAEGGKGMNVTVPFKEEAWRFATQLTERARLAEAVNTLQFGAEGILGDNTDGAGLVRDLQNNLGFSLSGKTILLMGAGGAARGVLQPLLAQRPARLTLVNRTPARADALKRQFAAHGEILACGYAALAQPHQLVINATSSSLHGALPPLPETIFTPGALAYDMMYAKEPTLFLRFAAAHGASRLADGVGMLVEQAAESFTLWRGVRPDTAPVIALLKSC